jgi:hypothetical protein
MAFTEKQINDAEEAVVSLTQATNLTDKEIVDVITDGFTMKYNGNLPKDIFDLIDEHNDDKFIIGFSDAYKSYTKETLGYFNTHSNVMYPSSHLVGKGVLFKNIFNVDENYEDELSKVFQNKEKYYLNTNH